MEKYIVIKDDTNKEMLIKAIENYEKIHGTTVLKIYVHEDHNYRLVDFNGISVTKWGGVIGDFINDTTEILDGKYVISTMEVIDIL